jgi:hypothetical protein
MDTVWERLGEKGLYPLPLRFLEAKFPFFLSSLQLMPCSLKNDLLVLVGLCGSERLSVKK